MSSVTMLGKHCRLALIWMISLVKGLFSKSVVRNIMIMIIVIILCYFLFFAAFLPSTFAMYMVLLSYGGWFAGNYVVRSCKFMLNFFSRDEQNVIATRLAQVLIWIWMLLGYGHGVLKFMRSLKSPFFLEKKCTLYVYVWRESQCFENSQITLQIENSAKLLYWVLDQLSFCSKVPEICMWLSLWSKNIALFFFSASKHLFLFFFLFFSFTDLIFWPSSSQKLCTRLLPKKSKISRIPQGWEVRSPTCQVLSAAAKTLGAQSIF